MADIFISYARSTEAIARTVADNLRGLGREVWWDEQLPAHLAYGDVIEERLRGAKVVLVIWSADAARSQWVRAEADVARIAGTLVQMSIDGTPLPLPFNQIQCVNLTGWHGGATVPGWRKILASIEALMHAAVPSAMAVTSHAMTAPPPPRETLLAVLAFDNLSHDPDLEYFSDGVSEEILYTVARAKGLRVIGKATSFQFRGSDKRAEKIAEALGASHILDGSVRRAGNNIRINAQLVDTASLETLWSERYDRALTDIFALQDEIAAAIADALNHHFAPTRVPISVDPVAYDLYLQARAIYAEDLTWADQAKCVTLLEGAVSRAPDFAAAWGRLAVYRRGTEAVMAAQRGLDLDPDCAVSLGALALTGPRFAEHAEKLRLTERAYQLTPDDQLVAGIHSLVLAAIGFNRRACEVADERATREPLSPLVAGGRAFVYRSAGRVEKAGAIIDEAARSFPKSDYIAFISGIFAIYEGDTDRANQIVATMSAGNDTVGLQVMIMFVRAVAAMDSAARAMLVGQFLQRNAPVSSLVDIGLAAAVGEGDLAMTHLLDAIRAGRLIEFIADNDGRGPTPSTCTAALFMANCEVLRRDSRFAEVCVGLGLYDCWLELDSWPDCVEELAPLYDLRAECARLADSVPRYTAAA